MDYFGARYYESSSGRWLSVDPLRDKYPGWSSYNYVMDNPIKNFDPDGKFLIDDRFLSFSSYWRLKYYVTIIGIPSRDNLFNPNAFKDNTVGSARDAIIQKSLEWAGEKGLALSFEATSYYYTVISAFQGSDEIEFLWRGEQEMQKHIYDLKIFDPETSKFEKLVELKKLTDEYKKENPEMFSNLLDNTYTLNPILLRDVGTDNIEKQLLFQREEYAIKHT